MHMPDYWHAQNAIGIQVSSKAHDVIIPAKLSYIPIHLSWSSLPNHLISQFTFHLAINHGEKKTQRNHMHSSGNKKNPSDL